MRVLFIAHNFPRHPTDVAGGFLHTLAVGQQMFGHEILALVPHDAGLPMEDEVAGVRVQRYRYGADSTETLAYRGTMAEQVLRSWQGRARLLAFVHASRKGARKAVRDFAPDLIHLHWWFPAGLAVWPGLARRIPYVLTAHGTDLFAIDRLPLGRVLARPIFQGAAAVTATSTPLATRAAAVGAPRSRIRVIPMPVDPAVASAAEEGPPARQRLRELLFVGRLVNGKGTPFAIRAVARLLELGVDVRLTIVGDGADRESIVALVESLGLGERVTMTGALTPEAVRARYAAGGLFIMPAITDWKGGQEGFGMVIVEAMAYGLPVVASRIGGIPDIVRDGENGLLVPERDVEALAAAVGRLINDPTLAERLAAAGRQDVRRRFAPRRIASAFDAVYRHAARRAD